MRHYLSAFPRLRVFLNYPFDTDFDAYSFALHFGVVAAGLIPVCAKDLSRPDEIRLEVLVEAIRNCGLSAHDLSKCKGEGEKNFARMNMPLEMGMALFHALNTQREAHRCAFFVSKKFDHHAAMSDTAGLDPRLYDSDDASLAIAVYEWLRDVKAALNVKATAEIRQKYAEFKRTLLKINGGGEAGAVTHDEAQEVMFQVCSAYEWWDWRANKAGLVEFPVLPLSWKGGQQPRICRRALRELPL